MKEKIALVTGANRGIGLETARQLAQRGAVVLLGCRDRQRGEGAAAALRREDLRAEALELDVTREASIHAAVEEVGRRHERLDILVNNAGIAIGGKSSPSAQPLSVWRETFETNLFGMVAVTQAFLPLLRRAEAARIVNLSSILGSIALHQTPGSPIYGFVTMPAYNVSKSAVNAWTAQLAQELRDTPIKVNAAHPGYVKTDMNRGAGVLEIADGARTSVALALLGPDGPTGTFVFQGDRLPW